MSSSTPGHFGEIGEKVTLTGAVRAATRVNGFTPHSPDRVLIVIDAGIAVAKLVTSARWAYAVERGDHITVTGTVKAHTEWRGTRQTVLFRATRTDTPADPSGPPNAGHPREVVNPAEASPRPFPEQAHALAPSHASTLPPNR